MKISTIGIVVGVMCLAGGIAYTVSPTTKYAVKGNIMKIENSVQLRNAIEILEAKNVEMMDGYIKISQAVASTVKQRDKMSAQMEDVAKLPKSNLNDAKFLMYSNGVERIGMAIGKLEGVKGRMKDNILRHKENVELLKAKLSYLDSLKTVNSYIKDMDLGPEFGTGINSIIEDAISNEEAVSTALIDIGEMKSELSETK